MAEIETQGTGQVEQTADQATLRVFYTEHAEDRVSAVSALTTRIGGVESALERDGVQVRDRRLSVYDDWDGRRRSGAQANQAYTLLVTDLTILNDLIADLVVVEPTNFAGPFWELADHNDAVRRAQRAAVADATRRAEGYAEALGCRLGQLLRLGDGAGGPQPVGFATRGVAHVAGSASRPDIAELSLEPRLVAVTATCTMAWTIGE